MINLRKFILAITLMLFTAPVFAQSNCDPWIVDIYKQLYNRQPSAAECNIQNYNNGSWSNYQQLTDYIKSYQSATPAQTLSSSIVSGDPWIMQIYQQLYNRRPNSWELNIKNYNNGSWSSFEQLKEYIQQFQKSMNDNGVRIETALLNESINLVVLKKGDKTLAVNILQNKGGNVVAGGGANVIAAGGGNVVAAGGANVVAAGGANVIAAGGGNVIAAGGANLRNYRVSSTQGVRIEVSAEILGAGFSSGYSVQSGANLQIKTSGNGSIVIK